MENKTYNSKLRALLSIRNLDKILNTHLEQMMEIEKQLDALNVGRLGIKVPVPSGHLPTETSPTWAPKFILSNMLPEMSLKTSCSPPDNNLKLQWYDLVGKKEAEKMFKKSLKDGRTILKFLDSF